MNSIYKGVFPIPFYQWLMTGNDSSAFLLKRDRFYASYNRHHEWSLPDSVIYYITKKPASAKCYQKMVKSCKYFFIKNSILVFSQLTFRPNGIRAYFNGKKENLKNFTNKFWIIDELKIDDNSAPLSLSFDNNGQVIFKRCDVPSSLPSIIPKLYQCDVKELTLWSENILFQDFIFLSSKCEKIYLYRVTVRSDDGTVATLEKVVEALPNIKNFKYDLIDFGPTIITSATVHELLKIPHFLNLTDFKLENIPEIFDIDTVFDYVKVNKITKISLCFGDNLSQNYKIRLETIISEIITTKNRNYKVPIISFPGMNNSLHGIYYQE